MEYQENKHKSEILGVRWLKIKLPWRQATNDIFSPKYITVKDLLSKIREIFNLNSSYQYVFVGMDKPQQQQDLHLLLDQFQMGELLSLVVS